MNWRIWRHALAQVSRARKVDGRVPRVHSSPEDPPVLSGFDHRVVQNHGASGMPPAAFDVYASDEAMREAADELAQQVFEEFDRRFARRRDVEHELVWRHRP